MKTSLVSVLLVVLALGTVPAAAQPAPAAPPQEFVPVSSLPPVDQLPAAPLLIGAYAFVWVALLVYVWSLWRRLDRVERELADLRRLIRKP
jgi:CcmD family protein